MTLITPNGISVHPQDNPDAYSRSNLTPLTSDLSRPLLLILSLADDNVMPANSFRLSHSLFTHKVEHELVTVLEPHTIVE